MTTDEIWINFKEKVLKAIDETVPTKLINNTKKKEAPMDHQRDKNPNCKRDKLLKRMNRKNSGNTLITQERITLEFHPSD